MFEYFDALFTPCPTLALVVIGFALASGAWLFSMYVKFIEWLFDKLFAALPKRKSTRLPNHITTVKENDQ